MLRQALAFLAFLFIRFWTRLLAYRFKNRHHSLLAIEAGRPVLYAFFHGQQLMLFGYPSPRPLVQMASLSKDGDLQAEILRLLGFTVVRGSSGKSGQDALYAMTDMVLDGCHAALAVDGSRGPLHEVKPGIIHLARDTGGLIIPIAAAGKRTIVLEKTWDKYTIPLPFSKTVVMEGEPISVPPDIDDDELEEFRRDLEQRLLALSRKVTAVVKDPETEKSE